MNVHEYIEKIATGDFRDTMKIYRREAQGPLTQKFRDTTTKANPNLRDYRSFLVSQTNDPKLGVSAKEVLSALDNVSKKDAGLLQSVNLHTNDGPSRLRFDREGTSLRATRDSPNTLAHELRHRIFHQQRGDIDNKGKATFKGEEKRYAAFDRRMNAKTHKAYDDAPMLQRFSSMITGKQPPKVREAMERHDTLARVMGMKDTITSEADANRGAINAILGKRSLDAATPKEKQRILDSLVGMTTYYEVDPRKSYSKNVEMQEMSKMDPENYSFLGNPFEIRGGAWKNMSKQQRKDYIQQIKLNRMHLESSMPQGKRMGKLYMSEMMKALRKTLRK